MRGRSLIAGLLLCCFCHIAFAQQPQYAFSVFFKDKNGSPFSLAHPSLFLSSRAISRRNIQGISIDSSDLPVLTTYIDSVLTLTGGVLHLTSKWLNGCVILLNDSSKIAALQAKPYISNVINVAYYPAGLGLKNNGNSKFTTERQSITTFGNKTTGSSLYYGNTYNQTTLVNGDFLHDGGYKGQGKLIAVLDAGFIGVPTHPGFDSLNSSGRLTDQFNFTLDTSYVYGYDDHGTSSLSTMAGYMPGTYVGTAPLASYALYVTEDDNSEQPIEMYNMVAGMERADSIGADILSISLGYNTFDNPADNLTYADIDGKSTIAAIGANMATRKGMLVVPSAGNEGSSAAWQWILTPGDADSALTVGAVDIDKVPVGFSGYGPNSSGRVKPDVCDLGQAVNIFTATGFGTEDGTSFATPMIAGWAACLWQASKGATPYMIRNAIISSADHYASPGTQIGYGVPDFSKAAQILSVKDTPSNPSDSNAWLRVINPIDNTIRLKIYLPLPQMVQFVLTDMSGKTILKSSQTVDSWNNSNISLDVPQLAAGVYLLSVITQTKQAVVKLLKT